jgi:flagellar hook-length control protein FliK
VESEVDTIEAFPILTFDDKGSELVKEQSSGFARLPIDLDAPPVDPKVVAPVRRTPAIGASIELPAKESIDIKVEAEQISPEENSTPKVLPHDQLTAEAIKREANLAASYLAQSTRESRDGGLQAIKAQVTEIRPEMTKVEAIGELKEQSTTQHAPYGLNASGVEVKSTSVSSTEVVAQLGGPILETVNTIPPKQIRSIRIRLKPEELGQVEVQLSRDAAGKVSAQMLVERENARQVLSQTLPQLRQALEQAGIVVDQLQVSSESSSFAGNARNQDQPDENNSRASFMSSNQSANASKVSAGEHVRDHKLLSLNA